jgi:hypothetical protein
MQIWLTYEEAGRFMSLDADAARNAIAAQGWSRRRCSDGQTRTKLPPSAASAFLLNAASEEAKAAIHAMQSLLADAQVAVLRSQSGFSSPSPTTNNAPNESPTTELHMGALRRLVG